MFIDFFNQFAEIVQTYWVAFVALGGFAVFEPSIINLLKYLKVIGEGEADGWQATINGVLFLLFIGLRILLPDFNVDLLDSILGQVAAVITTLLTFLAQFGLTRWAYKKVWKGHFGALGYFHS